MRLAHTGPAWKKQIKEIKRSGKESKEGEKGELYVGSKMRGNFGVRIHFPAKGATLVNYIDVYISVQVQHLTNQLLYTWLYSQS